MPVSAVVQLIVVDHPPYLCQTERERERERQTDRQTDRHRDRETEEKVNQEAKIETSKKGGGGGGGGGVTDLRGPVVWFGLF